MRNRLHDAEKKAGGSENKNELYYWMNEYRAIAKMALRLLDHE